MTGHVVHLQIWPGSLVKDCTRQCMYADRLSCGTPVLQCTPLTINLRIAKMQASGGKFRLATFDGELLQDNEIIPNVGHFKVVFMKQISQLPQGIASSLSDMCAQGPSSLGNLTPEDAHIMHSLVMNAMSGEDTNMTVDNCGTHMVVNLVFSKDGTILGILYQHANTCPWCNQLATQLYGMFDDCCLWCNQFAPHL